MFWALMSLCQRTVSERIKSLYCCGVLPMGSMPKSMSFWRVAGWLMAAAICFCRAITTSAGVGAVVLTNSDTGYALTEAVKRRLLEVLYDGKPEAAETKRRAAVSDRASFPVMEDSSRETKAERRSWGKTWIHG